MAHEVLDYIPVEEKETVPQKVEKRIETIVKTKLPPFIDSLILLNIATLYFFFTGLAILMKRDIPKEWMKIATHLTQGKIARKIKDMNVEKEKPKKSVRVVDLETGQNVLN